MTAPYKAAPVYRAQAVARRSRALPGAAPLSYPKPAPPPQISKKLVPPDTAASLYFGFKVAVDGGYALVTASKDNDGRGYLFARNYGT